MIKSLQRFGRYSSSSYLQTLYQASIKAQTPFFKIDSSRIQIIEDPLDFYLYLKNSVTQSFHRIGLSSLYLGTGTLQRHLLNTIAARHQLCPDLISRMVFDHHRSHRQQFGQSPHSILSNFQEEVGGKTKVGFIQMGKGKGVMGQIMGVHHQKIYIFDDRVVISGANLSKNYFLNRKDRYLAITSPELSDYLFDYLQILSSNQDSNTLNNHYKLWKYAYMPSNYEQNFAKQLQKLEEIKQERSREKARSFMWERKKSNEVAVGRNEKIAGQIGSSITKIESMATAKYEAKREEVRDRLFTIKGQDYVSNQLEQLGNLYSEIPALTGSHVYIFPFIHSKLFAESNEYALFQDILMQAARVNHKIRLSSGYLNLEQQLFKKVAQLSTVKPAIQVLCSSPGANSFYRGGGLKSYIPHMYRCYEYSLLKIMGDKLDLREFENGKWSYHAKGLWIEEAQNSYLTVVGSSNFNERSRSRDSQLQLYVYSSCKALNYRLNKEWGNIQRDCKAIDVSGLEKDEEIRISHPLRILSKLLSSVL